MGVVKLEKEMETTIYGLGLRGILVAADMSSLDPKLRPHTKILNAKSQNTSNSVEMLNKEPCKPPEY